MNAIYVLASEPEDLKTLLAGPDKHWKGGYSPMALAQCRMEGEGFPQSVRESFSNSGIEILADVEMLLAIPEHKVPLPGGARPSQNDLLRGEIMKRRSTEECDLERRQISNE